MNGHNPTPELLGEAERQLARRAYEAAHGLSLRVLQADPTAGGAWLILGLIAAEHGRFDRAAELFQRAADLAPQDARARAQLGRALIALNRQDEAVAAVEAVAPSSVDALTADTVGVVLSRAGRHARAVPFFEAATAARPDNAAFLYNLAASRQFSGDFTGAEAAYAACLALEPGHYRAWSSRVALRRQTPQANVITELEALFHQPSGDPDRALHLGHALAKTFEDLGDAETALAWLVRAKAAKRAAVAHDPARDDALFTAAATTARPPRRPGFGSDLPVFVVGLPRTGTTLVDRIISSHPRAASAGELTNFALIVKRAAGTASNLVLDPETLAAANDLDLAAVGEAYVQSVAALRGDAGRLVDKMPLNLFYAGLIHRALPEARIICLRRDPMDACLANYRQLFATAFSYYAYGYDLEHVGRYYLGFDRLVAHWRATLPADRFTEVAYEAIVADQEGETRRLLDFCGLDFDPACLAFHENAAPVATASSVQVRQPLYASSVGRWRRYGAGLDPLRRVLEAGGIAVGG